MPGGNEMSPGAPEQVTRVQEALAAKSRLLVIKNLVEKPMTFAELSERPPIFSATAIRIALTELAGPGIRV